MIKMNVLYIGYDFSDDKIGGNIGRKFKYKLFKEILRDNLYEVIIPMNKRKIEILKNYLTLSFNGQSKEIEKKIFETIKEKKINKIFFDGSLYGNIQKKIKKLYPKVELITFFHNIEKNYYLERIKVEGKSRLILLPSVIYNENLSVKCSEKLIVLNKRDLDELKRIYKKRINDKLIYQTSLFLEDSYMENKDFNKCNYDYLFIGSAFYANIYGITWFIEEVLPYIEGKLVLIGKGMEILKEKFLNNEKLEIKGTVENIAKYYYEENIIISPIFHGSGIKTKTIEALMYNKTIIGTKEAFVGIDKKDIEKIGVCCETKEEFIKILSNKKNLWNERRSREIYLKNFSKSTIKRKFLEIFDLTGEKNDNTI